jgi:hypothetical protein
MDSQGTQDDGAKSLNKGIIMTSVYERGGDPEVRKQRLLAVIGADRRYISEQLLSKSSLLLLLKIGNAYDIYCKARFCLLEEKESECNIYSHCYCVNLQDQTGKRKSDNGDDRLPSPHIYKEPDRYYHIPCVEQMFELGGLLVVGQAIAVDEDTLPEEIKDWISTSKG